MKILISIISILCAWIIATDSYAYPRGGGSTGSAPPSGNEFVTANLASTSYTIPNDFVGFSEELADVVPGGTPYTGSLFIGSNTTLINLVKMLGSTGFIRIGGNSQDWPNAYSSVAPVLNSTYASGINSFVTSLGAGWHISYGLSGKAQWSGEPSWPTQSTLSASNLAAMGYILGAMSNSIVMFSLCNEPDLYNSQPDSSSMAVWNANNSALSASYPSATYEAAEVSNSTAYYNADYPRLTTLGISGMQFISGHYYPEGNGVTSVSSLITDASASNFSGTIGTIVSDGGRWRLDETNMSYAQTSGGITDRMASAAWFINVAINLATEGAIGISPHSFVSQAGAVASNAPGPWYNNVWKLEGDGGWGPYPLFYGMFLFSKIENQEIVASSVSGPGTVNAISTKGSGGNANMIIVNNNIANNITIQPSQSNAWSTANVLIMAPSTSANCTDANPTVGGAAIGEGGSWSGSATTISSGGSFILAPCGAAFVQILP